MWPTESSVIQSVKLYIIEKNSVGKMVMRKEMVLTQGMNFWWMHSSLLAFVAIIEFHTVKTYLSLNIN
jgi:hypothetical protein